MNSFIVPLFANALINNVVIGSTFTHCIEVIFTSNGMCFIEENKGLGIIKYSISLLPMSLSSTTLHELYTCSMHQEFEVHKAWNALFQFSIYRGLHGKMEDTGKLEENILAHYDEFIKDNY